MNRTFILTIAIFAIATMTGCDVMFDLTDAQW